MGADKNSRDQKLRLKNQVITPTPELYARRGVAKEELHQHKKALETHETKHGSKREETAHETTRYTNTG